MQDNYEAPSLTKLGSIAEITEATRRGRVFDQAVQQGQPAIPILGS